MFFMIGDGVKRRLNRENAKLLQAVKPSTWYGVLIGTGLALWRQIGKLAGMSLMPRSWTARAPIIGVPLVAALALGWLLLVFAGDRTGMMPLPGRDGSTVEFLVDPSGRLMVEEAERLPAGKWQPWSGERYIGAPYGEILWLRITLRNPGGQPWRGILENDDFFQDRIEAWIGPEGERTHSLSGEDVPAREQTIPGREEAFPMTVPAHGDAQALLRIETYSHTYVRPVWWPEETQFHLARMRSGLAEGIYFGALLALLGYNALLWLQLRQRDIGYYVLYLWAIATFMFLGRGQAFALGWAMSTPHLKTILNVAIALVSSFLTLFAREFLEVSATFPKADRAMRWWSFVLLALAVGALTTAWLPGFDWMRQSVRMTGLTHLGLIILAIAALRQGLWQARFFLVSFGCFFAGSFPTVLVWFWKTTDREVTMRGLMVGSAMEMLLLSLAVADRFARAQRKLVEETEHRRMIEETYADELAEEVRERTRELQAANADKDRMLSVIGHDLRSPLTGLMRAADHASGEFAQEVSRTGRALLLMIEDLVVWTRLRAGKRGVGEHRLDALVAPAAALHHALAEQDGVQLLLELPEDIRVETDLVLAQTLVRNLLANALKFARTQVVLRAEPDAAGRVRFSVRNDGPPISPAVARRLAAGENEPMTATGGMGIRLCREICEALSMRLEARTPAEGGAEFAFTFKAASAVAEAVA